MLALSSLSLLSGCAGQSQLKPSDGSAGPIAVSFSNPDDPPGADGSEGRFWSFLVDAEGSVTPTANTVDGVLATLKITANPRSESDRLLTSYTVCLAYELTSGQWETWQCSGLRIVNKVIESGSSFTVEDFRFSIPAARQFPSENYWLVITVNSPIDGSPTLVHAHSQRGILVRQKTDQK